MAPSISLQLRAARMRTSHMHTYGYMSAHNMHTYAPISDASLPKRSPVLAGLGWALRYSICKFGAEGGVLAGLPCDLDWKRIDAKHLFEPAQVSIKV